MTLQERLSKLEPPAVWDAAGIAFLRGKNLYFGATWIAPSSDFTGDNPFPGQAVTEQLLSANPKIDAVWNHDDDQGIGVLAGCGADDPARSARRPASRAQ